MPGFAERRRLEQQAAREASGVDLWTTELAEPVRNLLVLAWQQGAPLGRYDLRLHRGGPSVTYEEALREVLDAWAREELATPTSPEVEAAIYNLDESTALTYVELVWQAFDVFGRDGTLGFDVDSAPEFERRVNAAFNRYRAAYKLAGGEVIPIQSQELHVAVVEPVLQLLHGHAELAAVERAYKDALDQIKDGNGPNAITDAATALQQTLVALGCEGKALGALMSSARKKGLLGTADLNLTIAIEKIGVWVSSVRNDGEAHAPSEAQLNDAWFVVHVVGALILRLADGDLRGVPEA